MKLIRTNYLAQSLRESGVGGDHMVPVLRFVDVDGVPSITALATRIDFGP
jgi:hypothetical protein